MVEKILMVCLMKDELEEIQKNMRTSETKRIAFVKFKTFGKNGAKFVGVF